MMTRMALVLVAVSVAGCCRSAVYYASPEGGGDGTAAETPFLIHDFWEHAQPGDTLVLLDGTYSGEGCVISPPEGTAGTEDAPITVRALNEGKVLIDGGGERYPVHIYKCEYIHIEGINACNSKGSVFGVSRSNHCAVRRCCGWDALDGNTNIFAAHYGDHNLFEDCAGWGIARKTYSCSQSGNYTTFRRCWGRWEGCHAVGPKMVFTCAYNSHDNLFENCIATWDGTKMQEEYTVLGYDGQPFTKWSSTPGVEKHMTDYGVDQAYGCFGIDTRPDPGVTVLGCIAYRLPEQRVVNIIGLFFLSRSPESVGRMENCIGYVDPEASPTRAFHVNDMAGLGLTGIAPEESKLFGSVAPEADLRATAAELVAAHGHILANPNGATVMCRYVDGELTEEPLWPWPMDERIRELIGVDVTRTVFELGGGTVPEFE